MAIEWLQKKKKNLQMPAMTCSFSKVYDQKIEMRSRNEKQKKKSEQKHTFQDSCVPNLVLFYVGFPNPLATVPCSQGQLSWAHTSGCL